MEENISKFKIENIYISKIEYTNNRERNQRNSFLVKKSRNIESLEENRYLIENHVFVDMDKELMKLDLCFNISVKVEFKKKLSEESKNKEVNFLAEKIILSNYLDQRINTLISTITGSVFGAPILLPDRTLESSQEEKQ